jgi:hypothetical protein
LPQLHTVGFQGLADLAETVLHGAIDVAGFRYGKPRGKVGDEALKSEPTASRRKPGLPVGREGSAR